MSFPRDTESLLRQFLEVLGLAKADSPEEVMKRLAHLQRALAPEHEISLILNWLGKCRLVHRLAQEQLPLSSTDTYRVPDLLAVFDFEGRMVPTLIEVKTTSDSGGGPRLQGTLQIKPHQFRYADLVGLPLLVAWRNGSLWTLFEAKRAKLAVKNYRIDFNTALKENLLGLLAGDFAYRLLPGTAIRMAITKTSEPDPKTGGFDGVIRRVWFTNPAGDEVPSLPHLSSLFLIWDDDVIIEDVGGEVIQSFVIQETQGMDFASLTFGKVVHALADLAGKQVDWQRIVHDAGHLAHDVDRVRQLVTEGAKHGILEALFKQRPLTIPKFLSPIVRNSG